MQITKNKIIFGKNDWIYGLNPQSGVGSPTALKGADTLQNFDPFRRFGKACPGFDNVDVTDVAQVATMLLSGILLSDGKAYAVGGALLHQITTISGAITKVNSFPYTVAGTGVVVKDIIEYNVSGTKRLFYSWYDTTDGEVGTMTTDGSSTYTAVDPDFMSTVPTGGAVLAKNEDMPMIEGSNGRLYIGVGKNLHEYYGNTDTLVPNKLVLPDNWKIKSYSLYEQMDYLVIYAEKNNEVRAFIWDYESAQHLYSLIIDGDNCGGGFNRFKSTFGVYTSGLTVDEGSTIRRVHLNIFDGSRFKRVASLPTASLPIHGGIDVLGDMVRANCGSHIYTYGSPYEGLDVNVHYIGSISGSGSGMLLYTDNNVLLGSSGATTSGGLQKLATNYKENTVIQTAFAEPIFAPGKKGMITAMTVVFDKICSGGRTISIATIARNGAGTKEYIINLATVASKNLTYKRIGAGLNRAFDAFQLQLAWGTGNNGTDAPIVSQVIFDYKQINI